MMIPEGKYKTLFSILSGTIDASRIFTDYLHTLAYGSDASLYRLVPRIVVNANDEEEVSFILRSCSELMIPVTFRAAGTSLSGQAVSDSVLLVAGENWKSWSISADAGKMTLQPGITGGKANAILAPFGRKIGPDPASINAAMIGGIAANNASGMCCGTAENSYKTVAGMRIVFADGSVLDTSDDQSREAFSNSHPQLIDAVSVLGKKTRENPALAQRIRQKYKIKNTTGYSLNALVDFIDPFDIIEHLLIGSEGTLGFISSLTYMTVANPPFRASSLMIFPDISTACWVVPMLKSQKVSAAELIDRSGLRSVENEDGMPEYLASLPGEACALLVEITSTSKENLEHHAESIINSLGDVVTLTGIHFTTVPAEYEKLWKIRKGLFPSVGAMRIPGTTVIIEDIAFPLDKLAAATLDLQKILSVHDYSDAVIFGHALEGNLHFVFSQDFNSPDETARYAALMADVADMVVGRYDGSLKAEHGTGRNMAPFVEMEWGKEAYTIMKEIKHLFDPLGILNPGVILNNDSSVHLKNLKPVPLSSEISDKCTECGFCETSCVSAGLTLTPRQRIVVHRELSALKRSGHMPHLRTELMKAFDYEFNQTCATDGLCSIACPVKIDCGKLVKSFRNENATSGMAARIASNMRLVTSVGRFSLSAVDFFHRVLGTSLMDKTASGLRRLSGNRIPAWNRYMPGGAKKIRIESEQSDGNLKVVYFPSCINRSMGLPRERHGDKQLSATMILLLKRAGYQVIFPENPDELCCGMAFSSKGYIEAGRKKSDELETALVKASKEGQYPIVCDMSPCLYTMRENMKTLRLYEPVEFILEFLVPHLNITPLEEKVAVFPVCSMKKMGIDHKLLELAKICASEVTVAETNCCGFAGDRGFSYPELNRHGLKDLREQIPEGVLSGYSNSRTCEIGLSLHSGITFSSIIYLVERASAGVKANHILP
jgi:D-lactate dehydrogenase